MLKGVLLRPGEIALREDAVPAPAEGELLIKVQAALTCGTDLKAYLRGHPVIPMPGPFGHEFSGTVAARGKGAPRRFKEGDAIMSVHTAPCRACRYCKKKLYNLCENIMESKVLGAFSEYLILPRHISSQNAFRKPPSLGFKEAALLEPLSCVVHGIEPLRLREGDTALVIGAGPIGLMHIMLLKEKGAAVTVADHNAERLEAARRLGADSALEPEELQGSAGMGFDYAFECTGTKTVWESAVAYLRRGGTLTLFGGCPGGTRVTYDAHRLHYDEITLRGDFHFTPSDVRKAHAMLAEGGFRAAALISGSFALGRLKEAFEALRNGRGIKYAIIP